MPAALLAVLLLTATVDPRPAEPLRLLADVGAHDTTDGHVGPQFASLPESLGLTLAVAELPRGAVGFYDQRSRTVTIAEGLIGEDPRAVAVILAHELQHGAMTTASSFDRAPSMIIASVRWRRTVAGSRLSRSATSLVWMPEPSNSSDVQTCLDSVARETDPSCRMFVYPPA
jgi:hypothetical protein